MRPAYFFIWVPVVAFAAFVAYATRDPWVFLIAGFWPAILGWRITAKFRAISESERHRQACLETVDPPEIEAANLSAPPSARAFPRQ